MGTLRVPDVIPSPDQDAEKLHKAFKGILLNSLNSYFIY